MALPPAVARRDLRQRRVPPAACAVGADGRGTAGGRANTGGKVIRMRPCSASIGNHEGKPNHTDDCCTCTRFQHKKSDHSCLNRTILGSKKPRFKPREFCLDTIGLLVLKAGFASVWLTYRVGHKSNGAAVDLPGGADEERGAAAPGHDARAGAAGQRRRGR